MNTISPPRRQVRQEGKEKIVLFKERSNSSVLGFSWRTWRLGGEIAFFSFFFVCPVLAQQGGQRINPYLGFGVGGTEQAMAGAAVGVRNDPACGYWNPAGLSGTRGLQVEDQVTLLSEGRSLNYLGLAANYKNKIFYGFTFLYYGVGGLEARQGPSLDPDSVYGDNEMAFLFSMAFRLSPRWSMGGNLKLFVNSMGQFSGLGFGEDLGVQYRMTKTTAIGFVVQDPLSFIGYSNSTSDHLQATLRAGIAHQEEDLALKMNFDLEWSGDLGVRPRLGLEWRPLEVIALRGGCWMGGLTGDGAEGLSATFTAGLGILIPTGDTLTGVSYTVLPDALTSGGLLHQIAITGTFL